MWNEYVPVSVRRAKAKKEMEKLQKNGELVQPVFIEGRTIAKKFWGKKWCDHLQTFADYSNRLPRGRTYARNGSVCHLSIKEGLCEARVSGSELYEIVVKIKSLPKEKWEVIKNLCKGQVGSILELLQGKLSQHVMEVVADHKKGLFPNQDEIKFECSCPDWAGMCKHVAAVLYGVGHRLNDQPELLFKLRGVDPTELVGVHLTLDTDVVDSKLGDESLADIFGIDIEEAPKKLEKKKVQKKKN